MTNEVINETENSTPIENPVTEETTSTDLTETAETTTTQATAESTAELTQPTPASDDGGQHAVDAAAHEVEAEQSPKEMDFGAILKEFEAEQTIYHTGELVEGKIVGISERGVLVDFGYKSEGIVAIEEFTSPSGEVTVKQGDTVEVVIRSIHSGDAPPMLSFADAGARKSWEEIETAFNDDKPITGFVVEKTKGGLRVDINGVEAFLPGSQVDSRPNRSLDPFVGHEIEAKIIKFSRKRNNIVLSRKVMTDEVVNKQKAETYDRIAEGYVIEGVIKNLTEYGAFVDIGGIDGLLHVTDMSWNRLLHPGAMFKVNDTVQVKVLRLDRQKDKVALGYKQLIPDPWSTVTEIYPVGAKLTGKISSVTDYGAFIELEPGVEGLVHVSEMSWSKRSKSPRKLLNPGEEVEVQVLGIDTHDRRISLGMKQLQENPWDTVMNRYHVGATVKGRVRNLTDFGAFVEVEDGIDGLIHVSDISHSRNIKHPKDVLKRDQEIEAIVTSIDPRGRRMSLSIKDLAPSEWETFIIAHKVGDVVRGKVSRFVPFGIFVKLGEELEGLCHISELSDERIDKPEDVAAIGQEMEFKILRIEHEDRRIGLSARAVNKKDEGGVDSKLYSTEAKGGMASLGELMNLKRGGVEEEAATEQPKLNKKERKAQRALERAAQEDEDGNSASAEDLPEGESPETSQTDDAPPSADAAATEDGSENLPATTETAETVIDSDDSTATPAAEEITSTEETATTEEPIATEETEATEELIATEETAAIEETVAIEETTTVEETVATEETAATIDETVAAEEIAATAAETVEPAAQVIEDSGSETADISENESVKSENGGGEAEEVSAKS